MTATPFLFFGFHSVESLLKNQPGRVMRVCIEDARRDQKIKGILELAHRQNITVEYTSRQTLTRLAQTDNHQGVVAFCTKPLIYGEEALQPLLEKLTVPPFLLVLDGVCDPHNLGACFRSADAAGVQAIIVPKDKSVSITPVVSKVASGAAEIVPFFTVTNLTRTLHALKKRGIWIYGAAEEAAQSLFQTDLSGAVAIVLGAEETGLRRLTREHCDGLIRIPMQGSISSLNVSVAAGIVLFEVVRQRLSLSLKH